ncbi:hypothetical protein CVN76_19190 [Bacillus sp. mrc49]|nr:hypothetical protein CVN76_19190 [Bacillus sp. mrc49]
MGGFFQIVQYNIEETGPFHRSIRRIQNRLYGGLKISLGNLIQCNVYFFIKRKKDKEGEQIMDDLFPSLLASLDMHDNGR